MNYGKLVEESLGRFGVDLSGDGLLWKGTHAFGDGSVTMFVLDRTTDNGGDPDFRVYRAFTVGDRAHVSVDLELAGEGLGVLDMLPADDDGPYDWRAAIEDGLGGRGVAFLWSHAEENQMSFIARTDDPQGGERLVCGRCVGNGQEVVLTVDFDAAVHDLLGRPSRAWSAKLH